MCGIAGLLDLQDRPVDRVRLERMVAALRHRGPDQEGVFVAGPIALGHTRLSIVDLAGGAQPMRTADGALTVSFNGEIFNHVELRQELTRRGRSFQTRGSDTEVILAAYAEWGEDCLERFNGQWAFALWDAPRRRLLLARDRLGIRPLYHARIDGQLVFASEIKAILQHPAARRELDPIGLDQIFTFWSPVPPHTAFREVEELPPGHLMVVEGGEARRRRYWAIRYAPEDGSRTVDSYAEELRARLVDAARLRLRADVPVGAYLSGGLDSSVITAIIHRHTDTRLKTFSLTFDDPEFDESRFQGEVLRHLGVEDHHQVRCRAEDIGGVFPEVIWHTEAPILRTAPAPLYLLARLVREQGYKVVLTGEGSDELLGGYDLFKEAKVRRFWARQPSSRLRPLLLRRLYPYLPQLQAQPEAYLRAFFHARPEDLADPLFSHLPRWRLTAQTKIFFSDALKQAIGGRQALAELRAELPAELGGWDPLCQAQYLETAYLLPGYLLSSQGDRMAMAHGVEGRYPFLDPEVVALAQRLPPSVKLKVLDEKHVLKRAAGDLIPASLRRRPKQPYRATDVPSFFDPATGRARLPWIEELLQPAALARSGLFAPQAVARLVEKVRRPGAPVSAKDGMALVGILSTQLLHAHFIDKLERPSQ